MKNKFLLLFLLYTISSNAQTFTDITPKDFPKAETGARFEWIDMDNDGDLDFITLGYIHKEKRTYVGIYRNKKGKQFEEVPNEIKTYYYSDIGLNDYNHDGLVDFAVSGYWTEKIGNIYQYEFGALHQNKDKGSFEKDVSNELTCVGNTAMTWGDYDNDGDEDVFMTGYDSEVVSRLFENDKGHFREDSTTKFRPLRQGSAEWGDYDNDGDLDLLYVGMGERRIHALIYTNLGNGHFEELKTAKLRGINAGCATWGDHDGDGDLDIFLMGWDIDNREDPLPAFIYTNLGKGEFKEERFESIEHPLNSSAQWGDCNNDGYPDLLITGANGGNSKSKTSIYLNNGDKEFRYLETDLRDIYIGQGSWGDLDNDGDLDIGLVGKTDYGNDEPYSMLYRNDIKKRNTKPTPPTMINAKVDGNTVELSWNKARDKETPSSALTYNIYIGTTPKSIDICSPMSDLKTGYRKVVKMGNVQQNRSWKIHKLEKGMYYWSVQAVDAAYVGSKFAKEGTFEVE